MNLILFSIFLLFSINASHQHKRTASFFNLYRKMNLDALLTVGLPNPALKHGQSQELSYGCAYTFLFNVLDMPSVALPVTKVRAEEEYGYKDETNGNDIMTKRVRECMVGA
jgi:Asp-tRNA(Asn)/Glu-tRNA(Gln) amidotransferase A subunit family amidase